MTAVPIIIGTFVIVPKSFVKIIDEHPKENGNYPNNDDS